MNKIRIAGAAAGVVLVSGMVLQVSSAAFTDTTDNAANSWDAGTVAIENDAGSAMFASTAPAPGDTEAQCLMVSYSRSEERRVGKACVRTCRSRESSCH